jgi:hypothetical protein
MPKRNRGKKKKAVSGQPAETANGAMLNPSPAPSNEEAMLHLSPAPSNEEAMLHLFPASSEEALLDPSLSPKEQEGEDNLLNQAIDMSGAAFLCSQDRTAANVVGN